LTSQSVRIFEGKLEAKLGYYAWKLVIVADVMHELKHPLIWMDAGTLICSRLDRVRQVINSVQLPNTVYTSVRLVMVLQNSSH